ncbi:beta-alanyl-dopamine/carcinine hydrolase [Sitodiplosis mosellana]|uniref:beta-alanyl-dopamine/carcinine hydrolase n=1 Tax=Sitodiplosis mosellana TaxID=263140 RepID=UPI002444F9A5|nr:beta-alanyl-dopamine/carcinine hydrolase [Sitodiplosis mosellana]XP_055304140.1 beta-alanyl-dopamine/carcinine hydrolase [Sitodiplosis mosellana]XP_055304141.1 beta-alanyl-dopamine/carcinine hydrolase [Sitodiplosis mosellana]
MTGTTATEQLQPHGKNIPRRQCIPILYTKGTHYDVGFDVGRTFAALIKSFLEISVPLNTEYLPLYKTPEGKAVYDATLKSVKESFPQYIRELEGVAHGAGVEFHKLFLLHMDDITPNATNRINGVHPPIGCSTICVNQPDNEILAHTEDALQETLNHFYIVSAHIIESTPQGKHRVSEERFTSLCYAGHLPGYTMGYNHHGLVYSINTLSANTLHSGKTPRHFITRALLSVPNFEQAQKILRDTGVGAADGCSINMTFLKQEGDRLFHNIEMGPAAPGENQSQLNVLTISSGESIVHANKYLRLPIKEVTGPIIDSSVARHEAFDRLGKPKSKEDAVNMLGDQSGKVHTVFRENGGDEFVKTIAVGIFDCRKQTWSLYSDNPKHNEPLFVLPLVLKS